MPAPPDVYNHGVDFAALALRYPDFAKKLKANRQLDFSDPESVRQLTKALLDRDFDLKINLPEDRLCPPVPNRFNYILFVQQLLDSTQENYSDTYDGKRRVTGLDIGTGASAIYPLLACRQRPSWLFLATEIDHKSRNFALQNIKDNDLASRIKIINTDSENKTIIPTAGLEQFQRIDILLTNPPFYTSENELRDSAKQKARPPNSACTGAPIEMICPGGEVSFVSRIIQESTQPQNKTKIQWFSSMLGKLSSVTTIIDKLRAAGCNNYAVTEFIQGQKTRRWCIAWSWFGLRPTQPVARGTDAVEKRYLPFPTELELVLQTEPETTIAKLNTELLNLSGMEWKWRSDVQAGVGRSSEGDVWSRHARRRLKKLELEKDEKMVVEGDDEGNDEDEISEPRFVVKISCRPPDPDSMADVSASPGTTLTLRWLQGQESTLFESFHGWLKRKLAVK